MPKTQMTPAEAARDGRIVKAVIMRLLKDDFLRDHYGLITVDDTRDPYWLQNHDLLPLESLSNLSDSDLESHGLQRIPDPIEAELERTSLRAAGLDDHIEACRILRGSRP